MGMNPCTMGEERGLEIRPLISWACAITTRFLGKRWMIPVLMSPRTKRRLLWYLMNSVLPVWVPWDSR